MKIDGKEIANKILLELKKRIKKLREKNILPNLAIILIGNDPASVAYVNQKKIKGKKIGAKITIEKVQPKVTQIHLLKTIEQLNNDNNVHGIIVQQPLPKHIDKEQLILVVDRKKDVDGFHKRSKFQPPIALAVLRILEKVCSLTRSHLVRLQGETLKNWLSSKKIVIIGKGETGGQPVIDMLKKMNIKPSIIDSKTTNPETLTKKADIVISCVGKQNVIKPEMIKKGVILIGVGLYKEIDGKMHGDYDEEKIKDISSFYTPTPGGVGPVNVAMLLENLVTATENSR